MMSLLIVLLILAAMVKTTGFALRLTGRMVGLFISLFGYIVLGVLAVSVLSLAAGILPLIILAGIVTCIYNWSR